MSLIGLLRTTAARMLRTRNLGMTKRFFSIMDDDGDLDQYKTTVSILNHEADRGIFIDSYSSMGFTLNTGIKIIGPCAIFPRSALHWNVQSIQDVNEESLSLFSLLDPKLDILVLGVGEQENLSKINPAIIRHLRAKKINVELLATDQALAVFNFLNAEKRYVAGAFIPPSYVDEFEDDAYTSPDLVKLTYTENEIEDLPRIK